jgi:hypothetical protein
MAEFEKQDFIYDHSVYFSHDYPIKHEESENVWDYTPDRESGTSVLYYAWILSRAMTSGHS